MVPSSSRRKIAMLIMAILPLGACKPVWSTRVSRPSPVPDVPSVNTNAELLLEVMTDVFQVPPRDRAEFGAYLNALNQGATLEGIYDGFTHSERYRELERKSGESSQRAIGVFSA